MNIDKDLVQKAVDEAFAKIVKDNEDYNDEEYIYSDEEKDQVDEEVEEKEEDKEEDDTSIDDQSTEENSDEEENVEEEEDVQDKVEEEIEEAVDENPNFNFLGIDINVEETENGKFNVKMVKDDKEKVEVLDSIELSNILGLVEEFFNELVLESEEDKTEEADNTDELDEVAEEVDESSDSEEENWEFEKEVTEGLHSSLSSLRREYGDKVEEIFEHGLLAKELALEMIKNNLTKNTVKELVEEMKEKDSIIASKKSNLQKLSVKYLYAKKVENNLKKANTVIGSAVKDLNKKLENKEISPSLAKKAVNKYKSVISSIINSNDPKAITAAINTIDKVQSVILSNVNKTKIKSDKNKDVNNIKFKSRNVLNRTGKNTNSTLLSGRRYDGIDEMSAEILRIAGIDD